jgi:hypothetical protein
VLAEFRQLRVGDKFRDETELHGPPDSTTDGRLWERWEPERQRADKKVNARTVDNLHPKLAVWFHPYTLVETVDCPYCEQVDYIKTLEWQIKEFQPCSVAHSRIEEALHMTYGTILGMDTCHHLRRTEWDMTEEGR